MAAGRGSVNNPLGLVVLAFLIERPMHPYELGKLLKQRNKQESIKYRHASLYMVVDQLKRDGYIEARETLRDRQHPERTVYQLTEPGRVELENRMRALVAVPVKEFPQFEAALALIVVLPPGEVAALLDRRRHALLEQAEQLREHVGARQEVEHVHLIEYEYRLALVEAEREYVQRLRNWVLRGEVGELWRSLHAE